jgi:uncharacterized protein (TIGR02996 family)
MLRTVRRLATVMDLSTLFRAVYEAPNDDSLKRVLADALQNAGDPRGDFIALQLRSSVISRRRCDKLLARHRQAFLGALGTAVVNPMNPNHLETTHERWEKGFLVECTVRLTGTATDCLEWSMVKSLHVFELPDFPAELASPNFRSLRNVYLYGSNSFAERGRTAVARGNRPVSVIHIERPESSVWLR